MPNRPTSFDASTEPRTRGPGSPGLGESRPGRGAHGGCADAHIRNALALALSIALAGCGGSELAADGAADLGALYEAYAPVPPTATSDKHDAAFHRRQEVLLRMRTGSASLGRAALAEFEVDPKRDPALRLALLDVAAHCAPDETAPLLECMFVEFGQSLQLRTHATLLLGEIAPRRALELFPPILRDPKLPRTYPDRERVLEAWLTAARKVEAPTDELLVELATGLFQAPAVRYLATEALAQCPTQRALAGLEELLTESSSDGLLRIKAAQALRDGFPREVACATLERVADRESNVEFLEFLADLLEQHCFDH
jgi:HEAT repeat protein